MANVRLSPGLVLSTIGAGLLVCLLSFFSIVGSNAQSGGDLPIEDLMVMSGEESHAFRVEVASTDAQRAQGLMHREQMDADHGMLFVFDAEGERYFWMKDTPLSLDIIFAAADGRIVRIAERTTPFSEKIIPSRGDARFVLELVGGTSEKLKISTGDRLISPAIFPEE
ncbi:DUF192 domain-containing protein [uncultured Roseibium sp.]|uniref:DUF192 domain-containing protein n=1 Tax=uncultured Roseibium sp. TaxID=1936171 RepID=UPI0025960DCA|nr:DUF192 domain-containing protein [uncultured Roseibium sp.]